MSALIVRDGEKHGLVTFVDRRGADAVVTLSCGPGGGAAVVVPGKPEEAAPPAPPGEDPSSPSRPGPGEEERPPPTKEYWPKILLEAADEALGVEGLRIEVDTSLLPADQLRFDIGTFASTALAYASEGYPSIQIKPDDAERWGVWALVVAGG